MALYGEKQAGKQHQVHPKSHMPRRPTQSLCIKVLFLGSKAKYKPPQKNMQLTQVVTMKCSNLNNSLMVDWLSHPNSNLQCDHQDQVIKQCVLDPVWNDVHSHNKRKNHIPSFFLRTGRKIILILREISKFQYKLSNFSLVYSCTISNKSWHRKKMLRIMCHISIQIW